MLATTNLEKSYNNRKVVKNLTLKIQKSEIVGLLGPNGAGKSTSFYMIAGLIRPQSGKITLDGKDITKLPMYQRARLGIGYLPQESSIFQGMSVYDNILSVLELSNYNKATLYKEADKLLEQFSISHIKKLPGIALSGGERRRVEIARCLANKPSYILLDEPLAGIDPIAMEEIKELIKQLKNFNLGILITDHNVNAALSIIDRGYIVYEGSVLTSGSSSEIAKDPIARKYYLGNLGKNHEYI